MKILDWYNHQGHQYEFSKTGHEIYLVGLDNKKPHWDIGGRPLRDNVILSSIEDGIRAEPDIVMWRRGSSYKWCKRMVKYGAKCIGVAQTTYLDYVVPNFVDILVWNSKDAMNKLYKNYNWCEHIYIPHGFDPNEFIDMRLERKNKILSVFSLFKERGKILGYDYWKDVSLRTGLCELWGHGNEDISENMGSAKTFSELINVYNSYKVYLNTSIESAMPRSRAEAMMCGTPLVTTPYYDISSYIKHGVNGFIANNSYDMIKFSKNIIENKNVFQEMSEASRNTSIEFFHISRYIKQWNDILFI